MDPQEPLLATLKRQTFQWFGYAMRHDSLSKTILYSILGGGPHSSQQRKCWTNNIKGWTTLPELKLLIVAFCRKDWKKISTEMSNDPLSRGAELH